MARFTLASIIQFWCLVVTNFVVASDLASELFEQYREAVYQIAIIDTDSKEKSSIGSGFSIDGNFIVTNYHVVSSLVHFPNEYEFSLVDSSDQTFKAQLLAVDVVNDLALLKTEHNSSIRFSLSGQDSSQGDRIFSMGNPYDLGMTVIDGTYNGLLEKSRHKRILFSGSLNPGMSGGPAINKNGEVIGVNVAKGPEQISFLVPVDHIKQLVLDFTVQDQNKKEVKNEAFKSQIAEQLHREQDNYYQSLLDKKWELVKTGDWLLPGELDDSFECWGDSSNEKDKYLFKEIKKHCESQHSLFVDHQLNITGLSITYNWLQSDQLNSFRFYNLVNRSFNYPYSYSGARGSEDSTDYRCEVKFLNISDQDWKVSYCLRQYYTYTDMYDFMIVGASQNDKHKALVLDVSGSAISKSLFPLFLEKFLKSLIWNA